MSGITNGGVSHVAGDARVQPTRPSKRAGATSDLGGMSQAEVRFKGRSFTVLEDEIVLGAIKRVRTSRVLDLLTAWRIEEGWDPTRGGRSVRISAEAILVSLMLLARETRPLHLREVAILLLYRLSPEMRELLGLPSPLAGFVHQPRAIKNWEENARNTFHEHILNLIDPFPFDRYKLKTWEEVDRAFKEHDAELAAVRKERLDEFMRRFIVMTHREQPRWIRRLALRMDLTIDQTFVAPPTRKGVSRKKLAAKVRAERQAIKEGRALISAPVDPFTGFYPKVGDRPDLKPSRGAITSADADPASAKVAGEWGWVVNIAARVDSTRPDQERYPKLIAAATLSIPNIGVSEEAVTLMKNALFDDAEPGVVATDKAYFANALPERLHLPAREMGYMPSTDYRADRVGREQGEEQGIKFVDDLMLCPATPEHLKTTVKDHLAGDIDDVTLGIRLGQRRAFKVHVKQKPDAKGKMRLSCPARGLAPTVTCAVVEMMAGAKVDVDRPEITEDDVPDFLPAICRQHAVTVAESVNARREQAFDYKSDEWKDFHEHARQSIESLNAGVKDSHLESMEVASRRRVRGFAAAAVFVTILLVNYNLRKIAGFMHDHQLEELGHAPQGLAKGTSRRRDTAFWNPYTSTVPRGLRPPAYAEERVAEKRAKRNRTKTDNGALPSRT